MEHLHYFVSVAWIHFVPNYDNVPNFVLLSFSNDRMDRDDSDKAKRKKKKKKWYITYAENPCLSLALWPVEFSEADEFIIVVQVLLLWD